MREKILKIVTGNLKFLFKVLLVWYLVGVFMEMVFKGFVTQLIDLDIFLWLVIILGAILIIFRKKIIL